MRGRGEGMECDLPFSPDLKTCIYYLRETQKNGVYVNYTLSESSVKNLQKGKLLIIQDKSTTVSHIFLKWCGAY